MEVKPLAPISGEKHAYKVTLTGLPALVCSNNHKAFVNPALGGNLLDHLMENLKLPAAKKKGLFAKTLICTKCAKQVGAQATSKIVDMDVALPQTANFKVRLELPVHACAACGQEHITSEEEVFANLPAAMVVAFKSVDLGKE
jgi:hypothetical protein